jgi:hypothetical protein
MWNLPYKMPFFSSYRRESAIYITEKLLPDLYIVYTERTLYMETHNNGGIEPHN